MTLKYEKAKIKNGYKCVIGCDEVGRGCLAGPVVAASVILNSKAKLKDLRGIKDSKLLTAEQREKLGEIIKKNFLWSIGVVSQKVVDKINIHNASLLAMRKAVEGLAVRHCEECIRRGNLKQGRDCFGCTRNDDVFLYIDGKFTIPNFNLDQESIIGGDNKVLSIAAASIIAKVYRDGLMKNLHKTYPEYNFAQHKGYGTLHHRKMIIKNGLSPIHRLTFCQKIVV